MARRAHALATLLDQVNRQFVGRDTGSDGWIGDAAHRSRPSDHNPNSRGVVCAQDFDEDLRVGDERVGDWLWDRLHGSRDPRIGYVIYEGAMFSSYPARGYGPWEVRPYTGPNGHFHHLHLSVVQDPKLYDDPAYWFVGNDPAWEVDVKLVRIKGHPTVSVDTVYVCDGAELVKIGSRAAAEATYGKGYAVEVVEADSVLGRLPRRDPK